MSSLSRFYLVGWDLVHPANPRHVFLLHLWAAGRRWFENENWGIFSVPRCVLCLFRWGWGRASLKLFKGQSDPNAGVCSGCIVPLSKCPKTTHVLLSPEESPEDLGFVHQAKWLTHKTFTNLCLMPQRVFNNSYVAFCCYSLKPNKQHPLPPTPCWTGDKMHLTCGLFAWRCCWLVCSAAASLPRQTKIPAPGTCGKLQSTGASFDRSVFRRQMHWFVQNMTAHR